MPIKRFYIYFWPLTWRIILSNKMLEKLFQFRMFSLKFNLLIIKAPGLIINSCNQHPIFCHCSLSIWRPWINLPIFTMQFLKSIAWINFIEKQKRKIGKEIASTLRLNHLNLIDYWCRSGLNTDLAKKNEDCFTCCKRACFSSRCRKAHYISWLQDIKYLARCGLLSSSLYWKIWKLDFSWLLFF